MQSWALTAALHTNPLLLRVGNEPTAAVGMQHGDDDDGTRFKRLDDRVDVHDSRVDRRTRAEYIRAEPTTEGKIEPTPERDKSNKRKPTTEA